MSGQIHWAGEFEPRPDDNTSSRTVEFNGVPSDGILTLIRELDRYSRVPR